MFAACPISRKSFFRRFCGRGSVYGEFCLDGIVELGRGLPCTSLSVLEVGGRVGYRCSPTFKGHTTKDQDGMKIADKITEDGWEGVYIDKVRKQ